MPAHQSGSEPRFEPLSNRELCRLLGVSFRGDATSGAVLLESALPGLSSCVSREPVLSSGVAVRTVAAGRSVVAIDGLRCAGEIFQSRVVIERLAATYRALLAGRTVDEVNDQDPFGTEIEWSAFHVYYRGASPIGIGGLYRYPARPSEIWLGRFGVVATERGSGVAEELFRFLEGEARTLGGRTLFAFTEVENVRAQRFYQKQGLTQPPAVLPGVGGVHESGGDASVTQASGEGVPQMSYLGERQTIVGKELT